MVATNDRPSSTCRCLRYYVMYVLFGDYSSTASYESAWPGLFVERGIDSSALVQSILFKITNWKNRRDF